MEAFGLIPTLGCQEVWSSTNSLFLIYTLYHARHEFCIYYVGLSGDSTCQLLIVPELVSLHLL